jgi:hypothetical protein
MIQNERIIERIMRMGIEHRCGTPLDGLWNLAEKQLSEPRRVKSIFSDIDSWFAADGPHYAFATINHRLQIVHVTDLKGIRLLRWRSPMMPEVC